jgi:hypothetical protein
VTFCEPLDLAEEQGGYSEASKGSKLRRSRTVDLSPKGYHIYS